MQCTKCGRELPEGTAFCPYCGEKAAGGDKPIYQAEVKGFLKSGRLAVYRDRVEFSASSTQKTVFYYTSLVAVKKRLLPTPAILFITEDARTEACAATQKNIHEAFLHVEQAVKPYLEARTARLREQGIRYSLLSSTGIASGGILNVAGDRVEFQSKSGKQETVPFEEVKSAALLSGALELTLFNGTTRSFSLDKELRDEVLAFVNEALAPYLARRKAALLERGIYFSFFSGLGQACGTVDIYADRVEFTDRSGQADATAFKDIRAVSLCAETLELHMVNGTVRAFSVDRDEQDEILAFVQKAIEPYVRRRTEGFDTAFGSAERLEVNRARGVFHIIRQNGAIITDEFPLESISVCQIEESTELNPLISGIRTGGRAIAGKAAEMTGRQGPAEEEEEVRSLDVLLTIQTGAGRRTETLRFGDFPAGISRSNPKYTQCSAEAAGLMDFLRETCPACERIVPAPPESPAEEKALPVPGKTEQPAGAAVAAPAAAKDRDPLGGQTFVDRISQYIGSCQTPMVIAFQGNAGDAESILKQLSDSLKEQYKGNRIWLHTKQFARSELGEKLPMFIGAALVSQLGSPSDGRVVKLAKAIINLSISLISQGKADGQALADAFFKDNPTNSADDMVKTFSELVQKRSGGGKSKVIVLADGLDSLSPAKTVEILEAMEDFLSCEGCVFAVAVDYAAVIRGVNERYGQDEEQGKRFFHKIFRVSFRPPASGLQMEGYVKSRLARLALTAYDEAEAEFCCKLMSHSIGGRPENMDRLFDSFELLKTLAGETIYQNRDSRLILFGLLCMQARFPAVYGQLVQDKDAVTPELLADLCGMESDLVIRSGLAEEEQGDFREFAQVFCGVIDAGGTGGISRLESSTFAQVLEFTSITSM